MKKLSIGLLFFWLIPLLGYAADVTYTVTAADLWDNGYDNEAAPRQSVAARFVFTTNAASVTLTASSTLYSTSSGGAKMEWRKAGVDQYRKAFTKDGAESWALDLTDTTTKTIEIVNGVQSNPAGTVLGSFVDSITYDSASTFTVVPPPAVVNRIVFYGDSITVGQAASYMTRDGYVTTLRNTRGMNTMIEGWGYRSLYEDCNTAELRAALVARITSYTPSTIYLAIGTNDYGLDKWTAAQFGTAYAALLDDLHTALPSTVIIAQTPLSRTTETANGKGSTMAEYRTAITTAASTRAWVFLVDGTTLLTTEDTSDGLHPSTSGHAKLAGAIWYEIMDQKYSLRTGHKAIIQIAP